VATSLRFGVLCRFTAYVAVDSRVVNEDGETRRVTQPVELPSGWEAPGDPGTPTFLFAASAGAAPPPMAAGAPPAGPSFAPVRASAPQNSVGRGPRTFASVPSTIQASGRNRKMAAPTSTPLSVEDLRQIAAVEARRLRDGEDRPAYERRDMLADLVSRLSVLLEGQDDPAYAPLRDLLAVLGGDGDADLEARWAQARRVLSAFGGEKEHGRDKEHGGGKERGERKAFWKR
jgi:Ca-activated chloride channel homolog